MPPKEIVELVLNGGVSALLALVVIYWYRVDSRERLSQERARTREANERTEREREDKLRILDVVTSNTKAINEIANAMRDNAGATRELRQVVQALMIQQHNAGHD